MEDHDKTLDYIYQLLKEVIPEHVYYSLSISDRAEYPVLIYQETNNRSVMYADDKYLVKRRTIQITLITKTKQIRLERKLEKKLDDNDLDYQMISEYFIKGSGLHRIYEIKMEEYKYEQ